MEHLVKQKFNVIYICNICNRQSTAPTSRNSHVNISHKLAPIQRSRYSVTNSQFVWLQELHFDVWCVRGATATLRQPLWSLCSPKNTSRVLDPPTQRLCQVQEAGASIATTTTTTILEPRERRRYNVRYFTFRRAVCCNVFTGHWW
jgi:hypothetical protein